MRWLVENNERIQIPQIRAALGLGRGSGRFKALLALSDHSPLSLRDIADQLSVDAPYATLIVNHLEALGLVTRTADPDDRRRKLVSLTEAGAAATARGSAIKNQPPQSIGSLNAEEAAQLRALLERAVSLAPQPPES